MLPLVKATLNKMAAFKPDCLACLKAKNIMSRHFIFWKLKNVFLIKTSSISRIHRRLSSVVMTLLLRTFGSSWRSWMGHKNGSKWMEEKVIQEMRSLLFCNQVALRHFVLHCRGRKAKIFYHNQISGTPISLRSKQPIAEFLVDITSMPTGGSRVFFGSFHTERKRGFESLRETF